MTGGCVPHIHCVTFSTEETFAVHAVVLNKMPNATYFGHVNSQSNSRESSLFTDNKVIRKLCPCDTESFKLS